MKRLLGLVGIIGLIGLGACGNTANVAGADLASSNNGAPDLAARDLSVADLFIPDSFVPDLVQAGVDLAPIADLATSPDLAAYSGAGGPCGGFVIHPKECIAGLVCIPNRIPDVSGTCAVPDGGICQQNGASCGANGDCCSNNCILRNMPGYCCQPGGCP